MSPPALLIASILALVLAPALVPRLERDPSLKSGLEGFVLASIGMLVLLHLLPHAWEDAGGYAMLAFVIGLAAPLAMERVAHVRVKHAHGFVLFFALIGLIAHGIVDGVALAGGTMVDHVGHGHGHDHSGMGIAVVIHRLPVGVALWWLVNPRHGGGVAWAVLLATAAATVLGYVVGIDWLAGASLQALGMFQGLVAGMLLHVMFHQHDHDHDATGDHAHDPSAHDHDEASHGHHEHAHDHATSTHDHTDASPSCGSGCATPQTWRDWPWAESMGALLGALLAALLPYWLGQPLEPHVLEWSARLLDLALESAPALVLGFTLAGAAIAFLPTASWRWLRGKTHASQSVRGMVFGLPLPICSCGVVPMYRTLVRQGVPASAAMAFLVATPELGIEALIISVPFLGWKLTWARLAAAAVVAFLAGYIVGKMTPPSTHVAPDLDAQAKAPLSERVRDGVNFATVEVVDDVAAWLLVGLAVAALFDAGATPAALQALHPMAQVALFAFIGLPVYVCASGATPIAAAFLAIGVSPGAALAFLLAGPATNVTTFGILSSLHDRMTAIRFGAVVLGLAIISGWIVDAVIGPVTPPLLQLSEHTHGAVAWCCLAILVVATLSAVLRQGPRAFIGSVVSFGLDDAHEHDH